MHKSINNLIEIKKEIQLKNLVSKSEIKIIAVSKTFPVEKILPLIDYGHNDFGENKVQEATEKWTDIKKKKPNLNLHMIGKLQSNKVKQVIKLFDYIHSLDSIKLAKKISQQQRELKKDLKIFIQINIGNEIQKSGVTLKELPDFYKICTKDFNLKIVGLMCLPPNVEDTSIFFQEMNKAAKELSLNCLSMGMSSDYLNAINFNATHLRIGSKIFGERS